MDLELISFKLCPFVQRTVITLLHKDAPYRVRYVDLSDPPDWFLELSPTKQVPILCVDHEHVLFESSVIAEFVDEVTAGSLLPTDPIQRARQRGWIEFASSCLWNLNELSLAEDQQSFEAFRTAFIAKIERLEAVLGGGGRYFAGDRFQLADAAFAPLFTHLAEIERFAEVYDPAQLPKLCAWRATLAETPAVKWSTVPDFDTLYDALIRRRQGYLARTKADFNEQRAGIRSRY